MIIKRCLAALVCSALTLTAAVSFTSSAAGLAKWDIDSDGSFTPDDITGLGEYLLGKREITEEQYNSADVTRDGFTDTYDLIKMRKELLSGQRTLIYTAETDQFFSGWNVANITAVSSDAGNYGATEIIKDSIQLSDFITKYFSAEKAAEYAAKYDEAFFADNVVIMNVSKQTRGDVPLIGTEKAVKFVKGQIEVTLTALDPSFTEARNSVVLTQFAMKKNQCYTDSVAAKYVPFVFKYPLAAECLNKNGWTLQAAFDAASSIPYYGHTDDMPQTSATSMEWYADYGFTYGKGNCYVMAAMFCEMAKTMGYDAHQISGQVPLRAGGYGPHSWVEVTIDGTVYVFDPDFTNETGMNGYQISYGQSGTWRYVRQEVMS